MDVKVIYGKFVIAGADLLNFRGGQFAKNRSPNKLFVQLAILYRFHEIDVYLSLLVGAPSLADEFRDPLHII